MPVRSLLTTRYGGERGREKETTQQTQNHKTKRKMAWYNCQVKFLEKVQQLSVKGLLCQLTRGKKKLKPSSFSRKGFSLCASYLLKTLYFSTTNPILQGPTSALKKREDLLPTWNSASTRDSDA